MILATTELEKLKNNIEGLNERNIRGASIDLSLSESALARKNDAVLDLFDRDIDKNLQDLYTEIDLAKGYDLKPLQYLYGQSAEKVTIPQDKCGILLPRSTFARLGLILPISSFANPRYSGHLPIIIFNASASIVRIPPYIRIMQLLVCDLKGAAKPYEDYKDSKYQDDDLTLPNLCDEEIKEIFERLSGK